jgi:hypothetical protein
VFGRNLTPERLVLHHRDGQVPGLELGTGNTAVAVDAGEVEHLAVEGDRVLEGVGRDDHEVDARDEPMIGHVLSSFRAMLVLFTVRPRAGKGVGGASARTLRAARQPLRALHQRGELRINDVEVATIQVVALTLYPHFVFASCGSPPSNELAERLIEREVDMFLSRYRA